MMNGRAKGSFETSSREWSDSSQPLLLFFWNERSGPSRRMSSLVAWVRVNQKRRLRVIDIDADRNPRLVERFRVSTIPALILVKREEIVGRLEGRATGKEIEEMILPHVSDHRELLTR